MPAQEEARVSPGLSSALLFADDRLHSVFRREVVKHLVHRLLHQGDVLFRVLVQVGLCATTEDQVAGVRVVEIDHQGADRDLLHGGVGDSSATPAAAPTAPATPAKARSEARVEGVVLLLVSNAPDRRDGKVAAGGNQLKAVLL